MAQYDSYILAKLLAMFGFASMVLIAVYWISEAIDLFDLLAADGHAIRVFFEFSMLALPRIALFIIPISAFVAVLYVVAQMISENEMVVLQTAGFSPLRLLWPVCIFGVILAMASAVLSNVLVPESMQRLQERRVSIQSDFAGRLLQPSQFLHPSQDFTVYIRDITENGEFQDVFLQQRASGGTETTYTAARAVLVRTDTDLHLILFEGTVQTLDPETDQLAVIRFQDLVYDLGAVTTGGGQERVDPEQISTWVLITATPNTADQYNIALATLRFEGHDRIAQAFFVMFIPVLGAVCLMLGRFSRLGRWPQILMAICLVVPLQMLGNVVQTYALQDAGLFGLIRTNFIPA